MSGLNLLEEGSHVSTEIRPLYELIGATNGITSKIGVEEESTIPMEVNIVQESLA